MDIHNIDLHYHAGQERHPDAGLKAYLEHARLSGRKILGLTDHLDLYLNPAKLLDFPPYEQNLDGLIRYRTDIEEAKEDFRDIVILFGPEIPPGQVLDEIPDVIIEESDFFIGEPPSGVDEDIEKNTECFAGRVEQLSKFSLAAGKPVYLAHPFRSAVNLRLIKRDPPPWIYNRPMNNSFTPEELNRFFMIDLAKMADALKLHGVSLEINGGTHQRIRSSNLPVPLRMLWKTYELFKSNGIDFVPGSDQHGFLAGVGRIGAYVPYDCFEMLDVSVEDILFLEKLRLANDKTLPGIPSGRVYR